MSGEFDLIRRFFSRPVPQGFLGPGDDCALMPVQPGSELAVSADLLVEGRHFFSDVDPVSLGHKSLAVNLSDLAAMGARPLGCFLSLSLPHADEHWLQGFSQGFHALAALHGCPLLGGDTVRSNLGITIGVTVIGQVPVGTALRRDAARTGDDIWVSGELGAADVALRLIQSGYSKHDALLAASRKALEWPEPQVALGQALHGVAHAAIDISDGLLQDLGHILTASACGAQLQYDAMPVAASIRAVDDSLLQQAVLCGGDVYQLCFTASPQQRTAVGQAGHKAGVNVSRVGTIVSGPGLTVLDAQGHALALPEGGGFDHFAQAPGSQS